MPRNPAGPLALVAAALAASLAGCSSAPALGAQDAAALAELARVAGPTSGVAADVTERTECWLPSAHLVTDADVTPTTWRVLCRVHWREGTEKRYQDTTCIGDFAATPMLTTCYRWTYYDQMPVFEDAKAVTANP